MFPSNDIIGNLITLQMSDSEGDNPLSSDLAEAIEGYPSFCTLPLFGDYTGVVKLIPDQYMPLYYTKTYYAAYTYTTAPGGITYYVSDIWDSILWTTACLYKGDQMLYATYPTAQGVSIRHFSYKYPAERPISTYLSNKQTRSFEVDEEKDVVVRGRGATYINVYRPIIRYDRLILYNESGAIESDNTSTYSTEIGYSFSSQPSVVATTLSKTELDAALGVYQAAVFNDYYMHYKP